MRLSILLVVVLSLSHPLLAAEKPSKLTVYTSRKTHLIEPLLEMYSKKTGVKIEHINGKAGALIQKIRQEGASTPADVFITVDAGNLGNAASLGLLSPIGNKAMLSKVPGSLRDSQGRWVALSMRARTLFYNPTLVQKKDLKGYEDLADDKWQGKLCLRTSRKVYNQSLVAAMIKRIGSEKTKKVVSGWVKNLAKPVFTSDTKLLEAINDGICSVGIANTYYLARLKKKGMAKNVEVFFPVAKNGGVHINISGAGVVKSSDNKKQAEKLISWLLSSEAQEMFAGLNDEYPVVAGVGLSKTIEGWGDFAKDKTPLDSIAPLQKKAVMLMDSVKYL